MEDKILERVLSHPVGIAIVACLGVFIFAVKMGLIRVGKGNTSPRSTAEANSDKIRARLAIIDREGMDEPRVWRDRRQAQMKTEINNYHQEHVAPWQRRIATNETTIAEIKQKHTALQERVIANEARTDQLLKSLGDDVAEIKDDVKALLRKG